MLLESPIKVSVVCVLAGSSFDTCVLLPLHSTRTNCSLRVK